MNENKIKISVISPVYGCSTSLFELYTRISENVSKITDSYEIILVNDESPDNSWEVITKIAQSDRKVKGVSLSRNFGQHNAITAGLDLCNGEWVVVMDCDLQDMPEEIEKLYRHAVDNNFDVVFAKRVKRNDVFFKRMFSALFYNIFNYFTGTFNNGEIANFSIIHYKVADAFRTLNEQNRDYTFLVKWLGFKNGSIEVMHDKRPYGKTSYSLRKLIKLGFDNIIANTNKPLYISVKLGFIISLISFLTAVFLVVKRLFDDAPLEGWTSVVLSIWMVCGLLMIVIGTTGIYIGKIFDETKSRPKYIIKEKVNF